MSFYTVKPATSKFAVDVAHRIEFEFNGTPYIIVSDWKKVLTTPEINLSAYADQSSGHITFNLMSSSLSPEGLSCAGEYVMFTTRFNGPAVTISIHNDCIVGIYDKSNDKTAEKIIMEKQSSAPSPKFTNPGKFVLIRDLCKVFPDNLVHLVYLSDGIRYHGTAVNDKNAEILITHDDGTVAHLAFMTNMESILAENQMGLYLVHDYGKEEQRAQAIDLLTFIMTDASHENILFTGDTKNFIFLDKPTQDIMIKYQMALSEQQSSPQLDEKIQNPESFGDNIISLSRFRENKAKKA